MKGERGHVAGATLSEQAVVVAGVLAESGATRIDAAGVDGRETEFLARATDLPGLIASGRVTRLRCVELGLVVEIGESLAWECSRPEVGATLSGSRGEESHRSRERRPPTDL